MTDLLLPIHVHALAVDRRTRVAGPPLDYERLPWFDGTRDRNGTVANLASAIRAESFSDHQFWLQPGVHLHWTLPDGLKRGSNRWEAARPVKVDELWMPPAPNRWLVLRNAAVMLEEGPAAPPRAWLVESDYVHPDGTRQERPAIAYPRAGSGRGAPWVRLGRQVALDPETMMPPPDTVPARPARNRVALGAPLTALGPGDPLFAASYPSCYSVFGLHDDDPAPADVEVRYTVYGWYSDDVPDPLGASLEALFGDEERFLALHRRNSGETPGPDGQSPGDLSLAARGAVVSRHLKDVFGWAVFGRLPSPSVDMIVQGQLDMRAAPHRPPSAPEGDAGTRRIGIGSTAAEALVALKTRETDADTEDRLVQALAATDLAAHPLDLAQKLKEARHNEQFRAERGPQVWLLRRDEDDPHAQGRRKAPPHRAQQEIAELNRLQEAYHDRLTAMEGLRQELFCDWSHYMRAVYPEGDDDPFGVDVGHLQNLIERTRLSPLEEMIRETGRLHFAESPGGNTLVSDRMEPDAAADPHTLAAQIVAQHRRVLSALRGTADAASGFHIGLAPGPRYWRPNDPVLAIDDPLLRPRARHGHDGQHVPKEDDTTSRYSAAYAYERADGWANEGSAFAGNARVPVGLLHSQLHTGTHSSGTGWRVTYDPGGWDPLSLEWEVEIRPLAQGGNTGRGDYDPHFVTHAHALRPGRADMEPIWAQPALAHTYQYLAGRSIVNPSAGRLLAQRLGKLPEDLRARFEALDDTPMVLPMGGFHDLLLMKSQALQVPVSDPIGLPGQKALAERVRAALGTHHPASPHPEAPFHPIRSGELHIHRLRVLDVFGRKHDFRPNDIRTPLRMRPASEPGSKAVLPLRLSQAARLNFRWLAAGSDDVEASAHPASSPVIGWLLANELTGAVEVYSGGGRLLGSVGAAGTWERAPGDDHGPRSWREIADAGLASVVRWMTESGPDFAGGFIETLDTALETIDPLAAARLRPRAALMGRPLAIVRARLRLVFAHHMALDQSLRALRARMAGRAGDVHGLDVVRFPVRLGEHGQLNDGLCGYWIENGTGFEGHRFHALHGAAPGVPHDRIAHVDEGDLAGFPVQLTPGGAATTVTLLMEPHGPVHATTGILPVKSIGLMPEHYHDQLAALRITFRSGPVLTPRDAIEIPLPDEPGFSWSWLERRGEKWRETPHHPSLRHDEFIAGFGSSAPALWDALIGEGRLIPQHAGSTAMLMPGPPDAESDRYDSLGLTPAQVERGLLDLADAIADVERRALYRPRPIAREGWLQLRADPEPSRPPAEQPPAVTVVDRGEKS